MVVAWLGLVGGVIAAVPNWWHERSISVLSSELEQADQQTCCSLSEH